MIRISHISKAWLWLAMLLPLSGCLGDLNQDPLTDLTAAAVYEDFENYERVLAKCYAGLALSGQEGPAGKPDLVGLDEGFSPYLRQYWKAQELPTDEAVIGWNDGSLPEYNYLTWGTGNEFVSTMYNRIFYQVILCNEFIRETSDEQLSERGFSGDQRTTLATYQAEARFLRALSYWHAIDMFGNVPFVTEEDPIGAFFPEQINRADLFTYIEQELLDILAILPEPRQNEYARADKAAAAMLLAKLYLNAPVYIGEDRHADCLTALETVLDGGYTLNDNYESLFLIDNHNSNEVIFPVAFDGLRTRTYGGMTFLVHAPVGGTMNPDDFGINGGWSGLRTTPSLLSKFDENFNPASDSLLNTADERAMFYTDGQNPEVANIFNFNDGYAVTKYKNVTYVNGDTIVGTDPAGDFPDTDYPMFRLPDAYLMYAEAVLRGGGGSQQQALQYVNEIRTRAGAETVANIDLDFILDERARELYWEGHRRTDLIRYGLFTSGDYVWAWKGLVPEGQAVEDYRTLFPIPASDLLANPDNLTQNPGY